MNNQELNDEIARYETYFGMSVAEFSDKYQGGELDSYEAHDFASLIRRRMMADFPENASMPETKSDSE